VCVSWTKKEFFIDVTCGTESETETKRIEVSLNLAQF
jgi:hypothetical protein